MTSPRRRRCAFLTLAEPAGFTIDDELATGPLEARGISVDTICWDRTDVDWNEYDFVIVRSTWDYHRRLDEFLSALDRIDVSRARLLNELPLIRWNIDKRYLRELQAEGVATIPTLWREGIEPGGLGPLLDDLDAESMIVKPQVGASSHGAWHLQRETLDTLAAEVEAHYVDVPLMAQVFVEAILSEGEYSLIYFDGRLSHTLLKTPKAGDFRSQEEHGGRLRAVTATARMREVGARALATLPATPLYARVDLIRANRADDFWLVEFELVEPALYFSLDDEAAERFAEALSRRLPG